MRIKLIDFDEHALVVTVARSGATAVTHPRLCAGVAADMLRDLANQLDAIHGPVPCNPSAEPEPQHEHPETLGKGGTLDAERKVWTDGTGHAWDLSVTWGSAGNLQWLWTGRSTRDGIPLMRTGDGSDEQNFDVVWSLYGPLFPTAGDRA